MRRHQRSRLLRTPALLPFLLSASILSAQDAAKTELSRMAGCTLQGHVYTCSKPDLRRALSLAATVTYISQPANHASDAALADLVRKLGKTPASPDTPSDLTFVLEPLQEAGVQVGPGSVDLARLRVFLSAPAGSASPSDTPGKLLWVQTFTGDASMAWPAIARATTLALQDQLHSR